MAKKKGDEDAGQTAADTYAELAATVPAQSAEQQRIAELEAALAATKAQLEATVPAAKPATPLDEDPRLDEPVLAKNPKSKLKGETNAVHTFRELGVHPDDLDDSVKVNPETGQIVKSKFIKPTSGNLIEMP
jgi:hypothetical protein